MKKTIMAAFFVFPLAAAAQDSVRIHSPVISQQSPVSITGYVETYYSYDLNRPVGNDRPAFLYSHNRHNEFNANLAFLKAAYSGDRVRANLALAAGTYVNANYAAEQGVLKNLYEANAGYKISERKNLWLDIGILPSHIGFESAAGRDNWSLTRSMVAENSPYFESGARLSYGSDNGKWSFAALALNGWQRITRVAGNSMMSWGSQVMFKTSGNLTLNYSTFFGTDKPDSVRTRRIYHNLYGVFQFSSKLGMTAGFDIGTEQVSKGSSEHHTWYTPVVILRYTPVPKWAVALRGEYFSDKNGVLIATGLSDGFRTTGLSLNVDYLPVSNLALRLEGRQLRGSERIFTDGDQPANSNTAITFAAAFSF